MAGDSIEALTAALRQFADERDWAQFHTPKNLVMALVGEVGELIGVDLLAAAGAKLEANARRYPADRVRGSADKAPPLEGST
jgi:hypothetical protein